MNETQTLRSKANILLAELKHAERRAAEEKSAVADAEESLQASMEALELTQRVAEKIQNQVHQRIAGVVTSCLRSVFGDGSEFRIEFTRARNKTEANLSFWKDGFEESPMDASSGGKVDLAALALRIAVLRLKRPAVRQLVVADEPLKHLSKDLVPLARELIVKLAKDLGIQFIITTHNEALECGKVIRIGEVI